MEYAIQHELTVLTGDVGFANLLRFPLESHHGVVVARFANELSAPLVVDGITNLLIAIRHYVLAHVLVILEPGRIRIRTQP